MGSRYSLEVCIPEAYCLEPGETISSLTTLAYFTWLRVRAASCTLKSTYSRLGESMKDSPAPLDVSARRCSYSLE